MLSEDRTEKLKELLSSLSIEGCNIELTDIALTHPSYNFEANEDNMPDYERLEFLGDSVLWLSVSDFLYKKYENYDEGKLTKIRSYLVSDEFLAKTALKTGLNEYIKIGLHEEKDGGRNKESILACTFEALFGAVYLSLGFNGAYKFVIKFYESLEEDLTRILYLYNSKEILQEYTQGKNKDLPEYEIVEEKGKAHKREYKVCVKYRGEVLGEGRGKTKKEAEKNAAFSAVKLLKLTDGELSE